jgi:hypothetical protein
VASAALAVCVAVSIHADGLPTRSARNDPRLEPYPHFAAGVQLGTVQSPSISEASGIAASRKNAGVLWVHNDSGDSARVFAMSTVGKHLGIYNLSGVTALDWEDMAVGPGPIPGQDYLYIGDIGDNNAGRTEIVIYRVAEPTVSADQRPIATSLIGVETLRLRYEDGPRDAETLMVDPVTRDVYIISKRESRSRVYRVAASELTTAGTAVLRCKAQLPWGWATGGDISPRGDEIIVRGYGNASVWSRPPGTNLWDAFKGAEHAVPLASEPQGEAVGYAADGQGYYTVSEGTSRPIYFFARRTDLGPHSLYIWDPNRSAGVPCIMMSLAL